MSENKDAASAEAECWCETCRPITLDDMRMVLCPICGNKRCPHATDHRNPCTGSNETGQPGSSYEHCAAPVAQEPAASTEPPKRPYGTETMSEYGIIPECDSAPTPPEVEQASIQQWPSDWADQLNGEYRQGLEDGRKEAQLSGNPVQLVSVQVDRSSNLQGSPVDKSTEMQDQLSAQDREDAV